VPQFSLLLAISFSFAMLFRKPSDQDDKCHNSTAYSNILLVSTDIVAAQAQIRLGVALKSTCKALVGGATSDVSFFRRSVKSKMKSVCCAPEGCCFRSIFI